MFVYLALFMILFIFVVLDDDEVILGQPFTMEDMFDPTLKPQFFEATWIGGKNRNSRHITVK